MSVSRKAFRPVVILTFGAGLLWLAAGSGATEETATNSSDQVRQLLQQRLEIAEKIVDWRTTAFKTDRGEFDAIIEARTNALRIKLQLARNERERVEIYKKMIDLAKSSLKRVRVRATTGRASQIEILEGESQVLKYRIALAREKAAGEPQMEGK